MKKISRETLEKRIATKNRKKAPKVEFQEQNIKNVTNKTTLKNRGQIYISGGEFLNENNKKSLIKDIDDVIEKYSDHLYGLHLIFTNIK